MLLLKTPDEQARVLQKLLTDMGWATDPEVIRQRLLSLNNGLVQEDEFIFILNWFNTVKLIHKVEQFHIPPNSKDHFTIPDIFVVAELEGKEKPYFIEIKTSQANSLSWSEKYYNGFKRYSEVTGIPVLIAWKWTSFNIWTVFKLDDFLQKEVGGNYKIDLNTAFKKNLLSELFGDYYIILPDELALIIKHKKVQMHSTKDGEEWETIIEAVYWVDRNSKQVVQNNSAIIALFFILELEEVIDQDEEYIYYKLIPSPNKSLWAQSVPVRLAEVFSNEPVNWLEKIKDQEFKVDYKEFYNSLEKALEDGTLQNIFHIKPNYDQ